MLVVGVDQGTTGTRARLYDAEADRVVAEAYRAHAQHLPAPGWVEHDPVEILENVRAVLSEVARGRTPTALGLANQGETVVAWDRGTGRPIHRAVVWQDTRTQAWMDELAADPETARQVRERTGLFPDPYFSAGKLRWLLDHADEARPLLAGGRLAAGTLDTWLLWQLSDGAAYVTDASTAARTLLFDVHRQRWDDALAARFGVPREILPEVADSTGPLAELRGGLPVTASLVDQPAAMVGQACLVPGALKASFGTGCFLYRHTGETARPSAHGLLTTVAWRRRGQVTYALDGGVLAAGSVMTWLKEGLGLAQDDAALDSLAASVSDTGGVTWVPALAGLAAPWWARRARAACWGMDLATTAAHLVRAAYEGIAAQVVEVVRAMERDADAPVTALRVDGGLTASAPLLQLTADLLGAPLEVAAEAEATVMGACYLAAGLADDEIARRVRIARVVEPRISEDERQARRARFAAAVDLLRRAP